jgi:flagellin
MPIRIGSNVTSAFVQRQLGKAQNKAAHAIQALSSGRRIVTAADDAAGFAISENLRGRISGLKRARQNAEQGISLIQVAEGGLNEQNNILIRIVQEFDRIARSTKFGSANLLQGSGQKFEFHVGADSSESNTIELTLDADSSGENLSISDLSIDDKDTARDILVDLDESVQTLAGIRAGFGALQSRFQFAINNLDLEKENVQAARSRIVDADIAEETSNLVQSQIQQEFGIAVLAQSNQLPEKALRLIL